MATKHLTWDLNSPMVKGYFVQVDGDGRPQEFQPFEVDPTHKSRVELADELWAAMG